MQRTMLIGMLALALTLGACDPLNRGPEPPRAVYSAGQALSGELDVTVDVVQLVSLSQEEWPDACLGLPQEGESCDPVLTPGWRITFSVYGAQYVYRSDLGGNNVRLETTGDG